MSDANCRGKIEVGGWTNDPSRNSLRLLPSGPDRVGEGPVRRQPPNAYMARGEAGSKGKRSFQKRRPVPPIMPCHTNPISMPAACSIGYRRCARTRAGSTPSGRRPKRESCRSGVPRTSCSESWKHRRPDCSPSPICRKGRSIFLLGLHGETAYFAVDLSDLEDPAAHPGLAGRGQLRRSAELRAAAGARRRQHTCLCARPDMVALPPPLLRRLRPSDRQRRSRPCQALHQPGLRHIAFPAHRSGRDHAGA